MRRNSPKSCADGRGEYWLTLHIDSMEGEERAGASFVEVTEEDLMTHPACDEDYNENVPGYVGSFLTAAVPFWAVSGVICISQSYCNKGVAQ